MKTITGEIELTVWEETGCDPVLSRRVRFIRPNHPQRRFVVREAKTRSTHSRRFGDRKEYWIPDCGVIVIHNDRAPISLRGTVEWWFEPDYQTGAAIKADDGELADGWEAT